MQPPTATRMRVRNVHDAQVLMYAVSLGIRPMCRRRLDDDERASLRPGDIYVWEERGNHPHDASPVDSIQRFTDGRSWGPSKAREDFLLYYEKPDGNGRSTTIRGPGLEHMRLIKQTYSAFVDGPRSSRKWHLNAYYTQEAHDLFQTIDDFPELCSLQVPPGQYVCARTSGRKARAATTSNANANRRSSTDEDIASPKSLPPPPPPPAPPPAASSYTNYSTSTSSTERYGHASRRGHVEVPRTSQYQLAPLEYLQNVKPPVRDPLDDQLLRSFRYVRPL